MDLTKLSQFEISKKRAILFIIVILGSYFILNFNSLFEDECSGYLACHDFDRRMARLYVWSLDDIKNDFRHSLHLGLLVLSGEVFGNYKVLSLVSSGILLLLTYLFTVRITNKRIAGILAMVVLFQSSIFRDYATSVTYPSFWACLFIFALYMSINKRWFVAPFSSILAVPAKSLSGLFMPATMLFVWFSDLDKKLRKRIVLIYLGIIVIGLGVGYFVYVNEIVKGTLVPLEFRPYGLVEGVGSWANSFREDKISFALLVTAIPMLWMIRQVPYSKSLLFLLVGMLLVSVFIRGFTTYDNWPYRFLPHIVIISMMYGFIFANLNKIYYESFRFPSLMSKPKTAKINKPSKLERLEDGFDQYY